MSILQDKDFLLYRLRLVLFHSNDPISQRFVSLPPTDEYNYISSSITKASKKTRVGTRIESLKDPFAIPAASPVIPHKIISRPTIKQKRYAGTFKIPSKLSDAESKPLHSSKVRDSHSRSKSMDDYNKSNAKDSATPTESNAAQTFNPFMSSKLATEVINISPTSLHSSDESENIPHLKKVDPQASSHSFITQQSDSVELQLSSDYLSSDSIENSALNSQESSNEDQKSSKNSIETVDTTETKIIMDNYFKKSNYIPPFLKKMLSTVGEEVEDVEQIEDDEELDNFRLSVVASRKGESLMPSGTLNSHPRNLLTVYSSSTSPIKADNHQNSKGSSQSFDSEPPIPIYNDVKFEKLSLLDSQAYVKRISTLKIMKTPAVSALSQMVDSSDSSNPFARDFSFFSGKLDAKPLILKIYLPFCQNNASLSLAVKRDANVQETIGYSLYEYVNQELKPPIPQKLIDTSKWGLRIVEDDGSIDDDFPALDRTREIDKFGCDNFALCPSLPIEQETKIPESAINNSMISVSNQQSKETIEETIFIRIHLYSTLEVRQTTTLHFPSYLTCKELFDQVCLKRKYDPKEYVLRMADKVTDVPMGITLAQLKTTEFSIFKKDRGGAGDLFMNSIKPKPLKLENISGLDSIPRNRNVFKEYNVMIKHLMGKYERIFTIDGDYISIVSTSKTFFDRDFGKTNSHHISSIVYCKQSTRKKTLVKFQVMLERSSDLKQYELETTSSKEAEEICGFINSFKNSEYFRTNGDIKAQKRKLSIYNKMSNKFSEKRNPLIRSNAVWDLTAIPMDTPLVVNLKMEFVQDSKDCIIVEGAFGATDRISSILKFVKNLTIQENIQLVFKGTAMDPLDYVYEHQLKDNDIIHIISKEQ